jgi:DME family drug/metabolite transporter
VNNPRLKGLLIALIATTFWATTGVIMSYLLKHYPLQPLTLAFWRDLFVGLALLIGLRVWQPRALRLTRRDVLFFLIYGFVGLAVFNGLWSLSVKFNGAAVATVLAYSSPAFIVLLARTILKEPFTAPKLVAVALSLAGCVLVVRAYQPEMWQVNPLGIVAGLGTGLAFAVYSLLGKWSAPRFPNPWTVTAYGFIFAAMGLLLTQRPQTILSLGAAWDGWLILLGLALIPTILGFGLYTVSLRYLPATVAGLVASLEPVLTALMAIVFLHEMLDGKQWLGAGLILTAVLLAQSGPSATPQEMVDASASAA